MKVKVLVDFHDNLKDIDRKAGEDFAVSRERFEEINAVGQKYIGAPIVQEIVDADTQTSEPMASKVAPRRRAKKAE